MPQTSPIPRKILERDQTLLTKGGFATQQTVDNETAQVQVLKATIEGDQAAIEAAQLNLDFATITAPFPGVVSLRNIDIGNLVTPAAIIATVTPVEPIAVDFTLPQADLQDIQSAARAGAPEVLVYDQDGKALLAKGQLDVINNQVDQASGTIKLKARFDNKDRKLWPGAFVQVAVVIRTDQDALGAAIRSRAARPQWGVRLACLTKRDSEPAARPDRRNPEWRYGHHAWRQGRRPHRRDRTIQPDARRPHHRSQSCSARTSPRRIMNIAAPFIARPVATWLLMILIAVVGLAAYPLLPVAPLPTVDFPTIQVTAQLPGASPDVMASAVATPLEKQLGIIPGVRR